MGELTIQLRLLLVATSIFALGLVLIFSTTSAEILDQDLDKSTHQSFIKQTYYAVAGLILSAVVYRVGYRNLLRYSAPLLAFFTLLLVLALIPGIGKEVNGSRRWLHFAGLSCQPSEFVKYLIPAYFIHRTLDVPRSMSSFFSFVKSVSIVSIPMFLILIEPNNGTTGVIALSLVVLFLLMRVPFMYWAWPLLTFGILVGGFASQFPYVSARFKVYLNPELDLKGKGHQPYQAKIAAGSGKLFGKGPGNSLQKLSYLPEAQNDYIAAIYAEEFGFLGILALILLYVAFASLGFYIAYSCRDLGAFYLAACTTFLITFQAFLNLGVVSGLLPSTGLNLPLFSQGGSSLMVNISAVFLLMNIAFHARKEELLHGHMPSVEQMEQITS